MTTLQIELSDERTAVLSDKANAQGMSLKNWIEKTLDNPESPRRRRRYTATELVQQCDPAAPLSDEDRAWLDALPVGNKAI